MISRLIEAKPEEMRVFLEEAAGISKYKERRRETSNRIKHTKENLDRLMDVLEEVEKQIKHLDRQAKTAERYGRYKDDERRTAAELLALRRKIWMTVRMMPSGSWLSARHSLEAAIAEAAQTRSVNRGVHAFGKASAAMRSTTFRGGITKSVRKSPDSSSPSNTRTSCESGRSKDLEQAIQGAREIREHIDKDTDRNCPA